MSSEHPYAFIIGCQRSGTTILFDILSRHSQVAGWLEPFFIWDMKLKMRDDDSRCAEEATDKVRHYVRREFSIFHGKAGREKILVEKSPENSFRIPFILKIFPDAYFINIIRDGRDTALSIHREWEKRSAHVRHLDFYNQAHEILLAMKEQPYWRNRLQEIWFEMRGTDFLHLRSYLNKSRWQGYPGWGPRFCGWKNEIRKLTILEFNALQWVKSVEQVDNDRGLIPGKRIIDIYYEDLLDSPGKKIKEILRFLKLDTSCADKLGNLVRQDNKNKWQNAFSYKERRKVETVQKSALLRHGYNLG